MRPSSRPLPSPPGSKPPPRWRRLFGSSLALVGISLCVLLTALIIAGTGGVVAGQQQRNVFATQTTSADIGVQYQLALEDIEQGRYDLARQRLAWIAERVPGYPGLSDQLNLINQQVAVDVTVEPTGLPPSDSDDPEELFNEAKGYYDQAEWNSAITRLRELQSLDSRHREAEVKEMLYKAQKALGLAYIRGERIEEGIHLLEQAEKIRPLDDPTAGELTLAGLYVNGQTYWGFNWSVVIQNFEIIYATAPNYRDVAARLWEARVTYGEDLALGGAYCQAEYQFEQALLIQEDEAVQARYDSVVKDCLTPGSGPTATQLGGTASTALPGPGSNTATPAPTASGGTAGPTPIPGPGARTPTASP